MLATALKAAGMDQTSITIWLEAEPYHPLNPHIDAVLEWASAFNDAEVARAWYHSDLTIQEARDWSDAGFSPEQADRVASEIFLKMLDTSKSDQRQASEWLAVGLPPEWVIRCVEFGLSEPTEARELFEWAVAYAKGDPEQQ